MEGQYTPGKKVRLSTSIIPQGIGAAGAAVD